jgi:hypothetical protein
MIINCEYLSKGWIPVSDPAFIMFVVMLLVFSILGFAIGYDHGARAQAAKDKEA